MRSNLARIVRKTHRNKVAEILALISDSRDVMSIKGGSPQTERRQQDGMDREKQDG